MNADELILAEYNESYAVGQDGAARLIWQSLKQGPGGTPDWDLKERERPGGGFYWKCGDKTAPFDWPTVLPALSWD